MDDYGEVHIDAETASKLQKFTKAELIEKFCNAAIEAEVYKLRCRTAIEKADAATKRVHSLQSKLDKAESYVEQGRAMVSAIMERWYEYDE